ncbi:MAG: type II secretion system protein [Pseudomonadota bacterium]|nr:type II secretion system protein [Pseudomonadota bacterium]
MSKMIFPLGSLQGFTLLEMAVVVMIVTLLTSVLGSTFSTWIHFRQSLDTQSRLEAAEKALTLAYQADPLDVDEGAGASLGFATGIILPALADGTGRCTSTAASFIPVAAYSPDSASRLYLDGYNQPVCIFITPRLSRSVGGVLLYYHDVAVVSPGANGHLDSGRCTTGLNATTGQLALCGDDTGQMIDGYAIALQNVQVTMARMNRIVQAMQVYFSTRYEASASRDVSIDYFASAGTPASRWDENGSMPSSGCSVPMALIQSSGTSPQDLLGLTRADVTDAYGQVMTFDNCSDSVRSPANSAVSMQLAPYTVRIQTLLPGKVTLAETAVSQF